MKVSLNWLRELVDGKLDGTDVAHRLTMAGLEVESRTPFGAFSGVIVAEVRAKRPHPNANKLTLVDVFDGQATTQVVCGAPNVPEPGAFVLWARPGARLPSGITLEPKDVRGVVSPGMLCAEDELGFGTSHEGIIVLTKIDGLSPGDDLAHKLQLPDEILEVNVTPNRPDCLGHLGIAREVAALTGGRLKALDVTLPKPVGNGKPRVEVIDTEGCPRYTALELGNLKIAPSPLPIRLRLQSLGVRAISNVVDATNWVLLERGQPLHAFDLDKLAGQTIVVRRARANEKIVTLDGQERTLQGDDVTICDAERPVAVGGVMGGSTSEVSATTARVLLESAYFQPARVRRTGKRLGLHTEASHRFERGVDPAGAPDAARRCAQLMIELAGAQLIGPLLDVYPKTISPIRVSLRAARTRALLGVELDAAAQGKLLSSLGLTVTQKGPQGTETLEAEIPTRRPDLTREIDLIEEIARLYGYEQIAPTVPRLRNAPGPTGDRLGEDTRDALRGLGFDEVITYAFVPPESLKALGHAADDVRSRPVRIQNPLREEQSAMRTSLVPGLLHALQRNVSRGAPDVRIFEVGEVFFRRENEILPEERRRVAGVMAGHSDGWLKPGAPFDAFDIKGAVEELLRALGHAVEVAASQEPWLHPGVQGHLVVAGQTVGVFGEVHPDVAVRLGVEARPFAFEVDLAALGTAPFPSAGELPRFPAVSRDLSFFIAADVSARSIREAIERVRDPLCIDVRVLEDYREPGKVPDGKKGMLWSFTYRAPDRTLTDTEVQTLHSTLLERLREALQIDLR
jgi:phenylalanyl-tRNA synthetase beta chain